MLFFDPMYLLFVAPATLLAAWAQCAYIPRTARPAIFRHRVERPLRSSVDPGCSTPSTIR